RKCILAALVIFAWAFVARAEDAASPPPPGVRPLADPPQLVLPQAHLFGDWLGARTWLEARGLTPTVTLVTDPPGNPTGGLQHGFTATNNLGVDVLFDLDKLFGLAGGSFEASFSERFGSSLTQEYIGNTFSVQQIFPGTYRLVQLAYRQQLLGDRLEV